MLYTTYPADKMNFVKGRVEDTLKTVALPEKIAILRLDTDWYHSTKAELEILWDRLQSGGILLVDDYCSWQGARTAVDQFFEEKLELNAAEISKKSPCGMSLRTASRSARNGLMKAVIAMTPASIINLAASPIRRIFSLRSSSEKPSWEDKLHLTLSPSSTSVRQPRWCSCSPTACASVDFPAPNRPVNQSTKDLCPFIASRSCQVTNACSQTTLVLFYSYLP